MEERMSAVAIDPSSLASLAAIAAVAIASLAAFAFLRAGPLLAGRPAKGGGGKGRSGKARPVKACPDEGSPGAGSPGAGGLDDLGPSCFTDRDGEPDLSPQTLENASATGIGAGMGAGDAAPGGDGRGGADAGGAAADSVAGGRSLSRRELVNMLARGSQVFDGGDFEDGLRQKREAARLHEEFLGPDDLATLEALRTFGRGCEVASRFGEAREIFERVLEARCRVQGPANLCTMGSLMSLMHSLLMTGGFERMRELRDTVFRDMERVLGKGSSNVRMFRLMLTNLLGA
jgi:hypothetical protein